MIATQQPRRIANVRVIKAGARNSISKATTAGARSEQAEKINNVFLINPPYPLAELRKLTEMSTILKQCITAYKRNIVGFGYALQYNEDLTGLEETPAMKAEWDLVKNILKYFHFDKSFEDVFAQVIEHREECGNAYLEILRDGKGLPVEVKNVEPECIRLTPLGDPVNVTFEQNGVLVTRQVRFRKYCQQIGGSTVWFKEFGDPRPMSYKTGEYFPENQIVPESDLATELLHFKIGDKPYGIPRWIGQLIHMYGARKAEELNYKYFLQGRHIPMAIILSNAELSPESEKALTQYAEEVEGVDNAHKFLIIETSSKDDPLLDDNKPRTTVELKPLAELLQKDALFLEYDEASRRKVQSAFGLPDIYVGRNTDFNRATAETARLITEEQVFEPERNSLEWIINNKLLRDYQLKYVTMFFKKPDISNTDDFVKLATTYIQGHAITPNDLREHAGRTLGKELEPFPIPEADQPIGLTTTQQPTPSLQQLLKSENGSDLLNLLKDIRDALEEVNELAGRAKST